MKVKVVLKKYQLQIANCVEVETWHVHSPLTTIVVPPLVKLSGPDSEVKHVIIVVCP